MMSEPTISLRAIIKDETAAQLRGMAGNLKQVSESASGATRSFGVLDAEVDKLSSSLQDQIIKLRAQKEAFADPVYRKSAEQAAQLRHEVDKLNEGINSSTKATEKHGITWSEVVSKYYLASQAFGVVKNGLMSLVDAAKQYDSIRSRLNAAEGSEALGGRDFKEAQEMAKKPGLGFDQVASTMATLRGMKVTAGEAKQLILGIGQANASAAGSAEQFGHVMYQIQQSVSLGRLMAEDLRPIVQQIPTLGAAINNSFGTTDAEALNKKLKESGKSVREFWLEVAGIGASLPAASDTIQNNLDNMGDAWVRLKNSFADSGAIKAATGTLAALMSKIAEYREDNERSRDYRWKAEEELYGSGVKWRDQSKIEARAKQMEYEDFVKTEGLAYDKIDKEEADRKESEAKKRNDAARQRDEEEAKREAKAERERKATHARESAKNVEFTGPNEVTMRDAMSWNADRTGITGDDEDAAKGYERREAGREKAEAKRAADAKKLHDEVQRISKKNLADNQKLEANAQKIRMDWEGALLEKKKQAHEEEMKLIRERADVAQKLASDQVYKMLQGEFTIQGAVNATKDVMFRAFADTTTKWIEEQILKMVFAKSSEAASTAASVAQASIVASAWAPASMATSIGTFGASTAAGSASWFTAMTAAQGYGMMPHERGGAVFGAYRGSREERLEAFVPSRVVPSYNSQTTTNHNVTNAQQVVVNIHGANENEILRILRKAGINGSGSSRR